MEILEIESSVLTKTYDLNITPYKGEEVKYMFSIENYMENLNKKRVHIPRFSRCEKGQMEEE